MSRIGDWFTSWKLVGWRTAVVVAFVLYVLIGFLVVPWIAERVIVNTAQERLGREVTVEKIKCNPFALSLTVKGLSFPDRPGSTMLSFDELYANLQASSLFRWALTLKEIRVDGLYAALRRFEDKGINVLELMEALDTGEETDDEFELPRALLQRIEVNAGRLDIEDLARDEPLVWTLEPLEVLLEDISTIPDKEGDNDITIGMGDGGMIRVQGDVVMEPFALEGSVSVDQLVLANLWKAVEDKFVVELSNGSVAADINYKVTMADDGLHFEVNESEFRVSDFALRAPETEADLVKADSVVVSGVMAQWPEQKVKADSLMVDGAFAHVWIEPDGTPSWNVLVPKPTQDEIVEAYEYIGERVSFDATLGRFEVRGASALFEDRTFDEPQKLEVADAGLVVTDISTEPESVWGLTASAAIGEGSRASADGTLVAIPLTLDADVGLEALELSQFQAYVGKMAPLDLRAGVLSVTGKAHLAPADETAKITFAGDLAVTDLDLNETVTGGTLLGWGDVEVGGIQAALSPTSLDVEQVDIYTAGLDIAVAEDGSINVLEFFKALGETEGDGLGAVTGGETESGLPPAHIARLELHDCYGRYTDATTVEPFEMKVESVNGTITNIATDTTAGADIAIDAVVDSGGSIRVEGELDPFDYARLTDVDVDIHDVTLPPMSPMSIKMIGFPIDEGSSSLDLSYRITESQFVSTNHIEIDDLQLGEKVEGEGKINLPVKLGVSLLKDSNGRITLDVPIEGDLENPEFVMVSAIQSAATDMVGEIAKAPFRALGRLVGGSDDDDLEFVEFKAGAAVLGDRAASNLSTLAKALGQRPSLDLEIEGAVDPETDAQALQQAVLATDLGVEGMTFEELESSHPIPKLEDRYKAQFSKEQMEGLRAEHTPEAAEPTLDEVAYRKALIAALVEAQQIDEGQLTTLGSARAEAIRSFLTDREGIDGGRISVLPEPITLETGDPWVRCKLAVVSGK